MELIKIVTANVIQEFHVWKGWTCKARKKLPKEVAEVNQIAIIYFYRIYFQNTYKSVDEFAKSVRWLSKIIRKKN